MRELFTTACFAYDTSLLWRSRRVGDRTVHPLGGSWVIMNRFISRVTVAKPILRDLLPFL